MRCSEVLSELAVPTDVRDSAAIDEHLADCAACRGWAERARGLDRLWNATCAPNPSAEVWDRVWTNIAASLDIPVPKEVNYRSPLFSSHNGSPANSQPKTVRGNPSRSRFRTLAIIGLIGLAQAAAVLLAVGLSWNGSDSSQPVSIAKGSDPAASAGDRASANQAGNRLLASGDSVEIEEGQVVVVVIRNQGKTSTIIDRTPEVTFLEVDDYLLLYSAMESLAAPPKVAMKD
jgi:hypothetical protein